MPIGYDPQTPCVVVLGVGHSNTTLLTRQLHMAGWKAGDADDQWAESVSVRDVNLECLRGIKHRQPLPFPFRRAAAALRQLPRPWAIKDPRFVDTLRYWIPVMTRYRPLLVWIEKEARAVAASWRRRGYDPEPGEVEGWIAQAAEQYRCWPWSRVHVHARDLARASLLFDPVRSSGIPDLPTRRDATVAPEEQAGSLK